MKLYKIISGGQNGADQAGLFAGQLFGYKTGGWMPRGFKTLDGLQPQMKNLYGVREHNSAKYPPRTFLNVEESDGTLRFAKNFYSAGELCTLKAIKKFNRKYKDIDMLNPIEPKEVADWIIANNIQVLNVAGNSENTTKGIYLFTAAFLGRVFYLLQHEE